MKPEKAIKDLQARIDGEFYTNGKDKCEDIQLGIEALKWIKNMRDHDGEYSDLVLPGETEE